MILDSPTDLKSKLDANSRLLGLDVGSKTIGLALSDPGRSVATPLITLKRRKFSVDIEDLKRIVAEHKIGGLVIGLPVNMDGSEGPACQSVRQFGTNVAEHIDAPIVFWDERLSTSAVERFLVSEADMSRAKRKAVVDKMAAAYILQGTLDFLAQQPG